MSRKRHPTLTGIIFTVTVTAVVWTIACCHGAAPPKGHSMENEPEKGRPVVKLVGEGYISLGAGCVAYHKGKIRLQPEGDYVNVAVDTSDQGFYTKDGAPIKSYTRRIPAADVNAFLGDVKRYAEEDRTGKEWPSTGAATVELDLPLDVGRLKGTFNEVRAGEEDQDPLVECIRDFVRNNSPAP
jgi:hypothetical protein